MNTKKVQIHARKLWCCMAPLPHTSKERVNMYVFTPPPCAPPLYTHHRCPPHIYSANISSLLPPFCISSPPPSSPSVDIMATPVLFLMAKAVSLVPWVQQLDILRLRENKRLFDRSIWKVSDVQGLCDATMQTHCPQVTKHRVTLPVSFFVNEDVIYL